MTNEAPWYLAYFGIWSNALVKCISTLKKCVGSLWNMLPQPVFRPRGYSYFQ